MLTQVTYVPEGRYNLFSLTRMMKNGWSMSGDMDGIVLTKGDKRIVFSKKVHMTKGVLFVARFKRRPNTGEVGAVQNSQERESDIAEKENSEISAGSGTRSKKEQGQNLALSPIKREMIPKVVNINKAHQLLGHIDQDRL